MTQRPDTHSKLFGYLLWLFGFLGSHRFYYGKPVSGTLWFFTFYSRIWALWPVSDRLDRRPVPDPVHGPGGRPAFPGR